MPLLDDYLSPHAQQALIAGLFIAAGWWVVAFQNHRRDAKLRAERVGDVQRALLAEIRAHVVALEAQRLDEDEAQRLLDSLRDSGRVPVIPTQANDRIFAAILDEVHVLPASVIDPVVTYYRQLSVMAAFAEAIRSQARKDAARAVEMFGDYLGLTEAARETGHEAMRLLMASIFGGERAVQELLQQEERTSAGRIAATLPGELAELRDRLSRRSSDRSGL